jgi:hypothetical protein
MLSHRQISTTMLVNSWQEVCFVYGIMLAAFWLDAVKVKLAAVEQQECYQAVLAACPTIPQLCSPLRSQLDP